MEAQSHSTKIVPFWKAVSYVLLVLLIGVSILWHLTGRKTSEVEAKLQKAEQKLSENEQYSVALQLDNEHQKQVLALFTTKNLHYIPLTSESNELYLIWDTVSKNAMIWSEKPVPQPKNTQFQLWVETEGKVRSVGLFYSDEFEQITEPFYINALTFKRFFITTEKLGGNHSPNMNNCVASSINH